MSQEKKLRFPLDLQLFASSPEDTIKELQTELTKSFDGLKTVLDDQAEQIRKHGETETKTAGAITTIESKIGQVEKELKERLDEMEKKAGRPMFGGSADEFQTAGQVFTESDSYKNMVKTNAKSSDSVNVKSFFPQQSKDLTSSTAGGGAGLLLNPLRLQGIIGEPNFQFTIRSLMNTASITTNAIDYILEDTFTNNAAFVAEKAIKPESNLTFKTETAPVRTLAHWIAATRQIIDDASMLRSYVDNKLIYGLKLVEEQSILYGTGTGENLLGIMNTPGVQNIGNRGAAASAPTMIDHIRNAITMAQVSGYPVTGIVMHPKDWATIETSKGTDGFYIFANVQSLAGPRLWSVPVVPSLGMVEGEFLVGGFGIGSQLWEREDANVRVSEHHADFFIRNQLVILAEERLGITTYRPKAFVKGSFTTT